MARLASIRQPSGQELHCTQRPALRLIGPPLAPSARGALRAELAVAAHRLGVERGDREHFLRRLVERVELARPADALVLAPSLEDLGGARKQVPELITVVPPTVRPTGIGMAGLPIGDRHARRRGRAGADPRADRSDSWRGPRTARTRARSRRVRPRPGSPPRRRPPAPEPTIATSHSSPAPRGSRSPTPVEDGCGRALGDRAARLEADGPADPLVASPADHRQQLRQQQQVAVDREPRSLHLRHVLRARLDAHPAEAPRKRQPLEARSASRTTCDGARRAAREEARQRLGDRDLAARRRAGRPHQGRWPPRSLAECAARRPAAPAGAFRAVRRASRPGRQATRAAERRRRGNRRRSR